MQIDRIVITNDDDNKPGSLLETAGRVTDAGWHDAAGARSKYMGQSAAPDDPVIAPASHMEQIANYPRGCTKYFQNLLQKSSLNLVCVVAVMAAFRLVM